MSRRPGGSPPPSVPRRPSRVVRPAKTGGGGKTGCPLSLVLLVAIAVTAMFGAGACGPSKSKQVEQPHPMQTARQHAP